MHSRSPSRGRNINYLIIVTVTVMNYGRCRTKSYSSYPICSCLTFFYVFTIRSLMITTLKNIYIYFLSLDFSYIVRTRIFPKTSVLPFETLSQTANVADFLFFAIRHADCHKRCQFSSAVVGLSN